MLILGRRHLEIVLAEYASSTTTRTVPTALSVSVRRLHPICLLRLSTTSTAQGYEEPIVWAASSTSTGWPPDLGGWVLGTRGVDDRRPVPYTSGFLACREGTYQTRRFGPPPGW
jgi:hypothetical protein